MTTTTEHTTLTEHLSTCCGATLGRRTPGRGPWYCDCCGYQDGIPTRTGIEAIDCTDCGAPHIVDYDTHAVTLADDTHPGWASLDEDALSFDCIDCGAKVAA